MAKRTYPPGPRGTWLGGNLGEFRRDRLLFLTRCSREYGDVVGLRLAHRRVWVVTHPDLIEQVLVTDNRFYQKHFALRLNPLVLGNGLLTSERDFWLRQRRLIQPAFLKSRIAAYGPAMVDATLKTTEQWQPGQVRDISTEMMKITLAIAGKALFDADPGDDESEEVREALRLLQESFVAKFTSLMPLPSWIPTARNRRNQRAVEQLDRIIYRFIQQRRESHSEKDDLLSHLLHARDEDDGKGMTDKQLRDEAMTLFLAGHETTALTLSWAWYLLANHSAVEEKLAAEVDEVLGGRLPTAEDVARMPYTAKIIRESMRLYPPAYTIGREALQDCELGGFTVRRGTTVLMPQWVVQRDPRFWDEPEAFRPERWTPEMQEQLPKFAYFPFGGGPRTCIGNTFAELESALVLATLCQRFVFTCLEGQTVTPSATFTLRPNPPIEGKIILREQTAAGKKENIYPEPSWTPGK